MSLRGPLGRFFMATILSPMYLSAHRDLGHTCSFPVLSLSYLRSYQVTAGFRYVPT